MADINCNTCNNYELDTRKPPCCNCIDFNKWQAVTPTTATDLEGEVKVYGWQDEFYRKMEINGYKRAEFIPEISDSVELFREFIEKGYFK